MGALKTSGKFTYASRLLFFYEGEAAKGLVIETMLAYWFSWFVLSTVSEDGLNAFFLPLAFLLMEETGAGPNLPEIPICEVGWMLGECGAILGPIQYGDPRGFKFFPNVRLGEINNFSPKTHRVPCQGKWVKWPLLMGWGGWNPPTYTSHGHGGG